MKKIQIIGVRETPASPKSGKCKLSKSEEITAKCNAHIPKALRYKSIDYRKITSSRTKYD